MNRPPPHSVARFGGNLQFVGSFEVLLCQTNLLQNMLCTNSVLMQGEMRDRVGGRIQNNLTLLTATTSKTTTTSNNNSSLTRYTSIPSWLNVSLAINSVMYRTWHQVQHPRLTWIPGDLASFFQEEKFNEGFCKKP